MQIRITDEAITALKRYRQHQEDLRKTGTDKESRIEIEECRSYAVDFLQAILFANPTLAKFTSTFDEQYEAAKRIGDELFGK